MQEDTRRLLQECNSGCKMAINSMKQVQEYVSEETLRKLIGESMKRHEEYEAESTKLLNENGEQEKSPNPCVTAFSWFTTELKMAMKKEDATMAKIMMDGCHMGIESLAKKLNEFTNASAESRSLTERIIKEEEEFMQQMKPFL